MVQETPGAANYRRNICPSEKTPFEKVAETFSKQKLSLLNCDWRQSAKIIQISRANEHLSNLLYQKMQFNHRNQFIGVIIESANRNETDYNRDGIMMQ